MVSELGVLLNCELLPRIFVILATGSSKKPCYITLNFEYSMPSKFKFPKVFKGTSAVKFMLINLTQILIFHLYHTKTYIRTTNSPPPKKNKKLTMHVHVIHHSLEVIIP